ncbi:hypothetical protein FB451DRAFT_1187634 [Mycena latifolia]|nr:hypothetical protein FB451DRAFT_1187634 [Mycena latifolia]
MFFTFISLALLVLSPVHASPKPHPANAVLPSSIHVSGRVTHYYWFVASLNPVDTFSGTPPLEVLVGKAASPPGDFGIWERSKLSTDEYVFQNLGTGQWITVDEANRHNLGNCTMLSEKEDIESAVEAEEEGVPESESEYESRSLLSQLEASASVLATWLTRNARCSSSADSWCEIQEGIEVSQ